MKKYLAEMIGTMVLVLMGCGVAVSLNCSSDCADTANAGTVLGTALAFGLSVVAMAYTIGGISGCHINPAITLGMLISRRISPKDAGMYMLFQVIGAVIGSCILWLLTSGTESLAGGTGANDLQSGISVMSGLLAEVFFTFVFVLVVLGATARTNGATSGFACIRYTGTSVNPARSIGPALFQGGSALANLWIFIVGPFVGATLAAIVWRVVDTNKAA